MRENVATFPTPGSNLGLRSLAREMEAFATNALRPPKSLPSEAPRGDGHTVLVLPGFLAGDWTTQRLRNAIEQQGYRVEVPEIIFNAGPTRHILERLYRKLTELAELSSAKISIVGVSLGGVLARQLALDSPEKIRCVITLCSPLRYPVVTPLQPFAQALAPFHQRDWLRRRDEIGGPLRVPVTAIYSEEDGIVDWRQCLQVEAPGAINIRVRSAHTTVGSCHEAHLAVAQALATSSPEQ